MPGDNSTLVRPRSTAAPRAPYPTTPVRQYSFTGNSTNNPTSQQPGDRMDSEYDRSNASISQIIAWCGASLNTDGTLKTASVGSQQIAPGVFDFIAEDAINQVQPLVDQAHSYSTSAASSATSAAGSATTAQGAANTATGAASAANSSATAAQTSATTAQNSANSANTSASDADNAANHASGSEAICQDYADVTMAWAEHMPDTIPPNILAVMNITGDHWSSRWWANHASEIIQDAENNLDDLGQSWVDKINDTGQGYLDELEDNFQSYITQFQTLYLGAFYSPPVTDSQGNPVAIGALYYNLLLQAPYVWNGTAWVPFITPSPTQIFKYLYVATAGQTVFSGPDRNGNTLTYNAANKQQVSVWQAGLLKTPTDDYTASINTVTLRTGATIGQIVQIYIEAVPTMPNLTWHTARLDTSAWTPTGGALKDSLGNSLTLAGASDVLVSVDGVWQSASSDYVVSSNILTFNQAHATDSIVFGIAIVPTPAAPTTPVTNMLNTAGWTFDGSATAFPLLDAQNNPITPPNSSTVMISLNGIWQQAEIDYTINGSIVTFTTAPEPDATVFGLAGLP